ncbi:hypothetical protein ABTY63_15050 [Streptomyces solisilvae]|uniref:hypothetical protein n=1 Tax=Streptomyces malaysiensis TaxID=92644 RepID=UPI00331B6047
MTTTLIGPVPQLVWTQTHDGLLAATDADSVHWGIVRHATPPGAPRPAEGAPSGPRWWLHQLGQGDEPPAVTDLAAYAAAPLVCEGEVEPSVPQVLRYADALAAGWRSAAWRIENGTAYGDLVMVRDGQHAPVSALIGEPVMVHPQRLAESCARRNGLEVAQRRLEDLATVASNAGTMLDPVVVLAVLGGSRREAGDE